MFTLHFSNAAQASQSQFPYTNLACAQSDVQKSVDLQLLRTQALSPTPTPFATPATTTPPFLQCACAATEVDAVAAYKATSSEGLEPCIKLLQQAARDKSVKPELVEGALAYLEQNHGGQQTCSSCWALRGGGFWG